MKKKYFFFLFIISFFKGQTNNENYFSYDTYYGKTIGKIKGTTQNYLQGYAISYEKSLEGNNQEWVLFLSAKKIIFNIAYLDMNHIKIPLNDRIYSFGNIYTLTTGVDFKLAKIENLNFYFSPTIGLAYVSKTINTDKDSYFFGSHINAQFEAALKLEYLFSKQYAIDSKIGFIHFSNGAIKIPNAGVNAVFLGIGIKKNILSSSKNNFNNEQEIKKNSLEFGIGAGQRGKYKMKEAFYRIFLNLGYSHFINKTIGFKISLDGTYYDKVYNPLIYDDSIPYWGKSYDHFILGSSIGPEIKMNKISANFQFGKYIYFKSPYNQKYYWKAGLRYYITPNFGLEGQMNAHKVQADFISFGFFKKL